VVKGETAFIETQAEGRSRLRAKRSVMIDRAVIIPNDEDLTFRLPRRPGAKPPFFEGYGR
jgi:excinuclease ABC subunit A